MGYVLQYFDNLINEQNIFYSKSNRVSYSNNELHAEIRDESLLIQDKLREIYYSEREGRLLTPYLKKISRRLEMLLSSIEVEIRALKSHSVIEYSAWSTTSFMNLQSARSEMIGILSLMQFEFEVPGIEVQKWDDNKTQWISKRELFQDHLLLKDCVINEKTIPKEIIDKYNIEYMIEELCPEYFQYSKLHSLAKDIGSNDSLAEYTFNELEEDYQNKYINERSDRSFAYAHIWDVLTENTKALSEEAKMEYIIDFFLHTGLCEDIVLDYYRNELLVLESKAENSVPSYIKNLTIKLHEIKSNPKYAKYKVCRIEDSYIDSIEQMFSFLAYYKELYGIGESEDLGVDSNINEKSQLKKIITTLERKELAILIALLIDEKIIGKNKTDASSVISNCFEIQGKGAINASTFYNELTGWKEKDGRKEDVQKAINDLLKKLQDMVRTLIKVG